MTVVAAIIAIIIRVVVKRNPKILIRVWDVLLPQVLSCRRLFLQYCLCCLVLPLLLGLLPLLLLLLLLLPLLLALLHSDLLLLYAGHASSMFRAE